jgi:hypothetical protein
VTDLNLLNRNKDPPAKPLRPSPKDTSGKNTDNPHIYYSKPSNPQVTASAQVISPPINVNSTSNICKVTNFVFNTGSGNASNTPATN